MKRKNSGVTLIALIITIIVLLILAGVTIAMIVGDNGILNQATNASDETVIGEEKDFISIAYNGAKSKNLGNVVTDSDLNEQFSLNGTNAEATGEGNIVVKFLDTNHEYIIKEDGSIIEITTDQVNDSNPGEFNGDGTETNPYLIESIEDLVALATNVNSGENYDGKYFKLVQDLDFYSDKSYANPDTKYKYNSTKYGWEESSDGESIKTLCTTGEGWIPIGRSSSDFYGVFNGNSYSINNLYINIEEEKDDLNIGLFGRINGDTQINNLKLTGKITVQGTQSYVIGGIAGEVQCNTGYAKIANCDVDVNIECNTTTKCGIGGIAGIAWGTIEDCNNYGNIIVNANKSYYAAGIAGMIGSSEVDQIINCDNYGDIKVISESDERIYDNIAAGIVAYNNGALIENCANCGDIERTSTVGVCVVGGITGYNDSWSYSSSTVIATVKDCINKGDLKAISEQNDCYVGGVSGYSEPLTEIENSSNEGILEATAENGTVYKDDIVAKVEE